MGEVDDTIHLTFNEDVLRAEDLENADVVVAVVDGRLFGPYDVKEFAATPAFNEYKISGQQDRRFEHTALDASETLASQAESLFEGEPYSKWGNADVRRTIGTIVKVAVQHSRSLAGMRSALSDYGLSIFPHAVLSISGDVMTRVRAASLAPVVPTSVSTPVADAGHRGRSRRRIQQHHRDPPRSGVSRGARHRQAQAPRHRLPRSRRLERPRRLR